MEYKRAAVMLPSILKRAVLLVAVCLAAVGGIAFCAGISPDGGSGEPLLKVGYTAQENRVTALAVAYVQGMESVKSLCSLEPVTEQEGKQLLQEGELSALIVLPDDVINEILSGSNAPATLYLPENHNRVVSGGGLGAVGSMLFEELAAAGIGMLGTAQAEIYAADAVLQELSGQPGYGTEGLGIDLLQPMYDDINRFNLQTATGREGLFQKRTLSLTGNDTYAVYYGSAFAAIYMMLAGLFFGGFCKRSSLQQAMADRRNGVGYTAQLAARCLAGSMLMFFVCLLPCLLLFALQLLLEADSALTIRVTWQGAVSLLLAVGFMTIYYMFIYQIVEKRESAVVVLGILALLQSYLAGCLIPSVLLPGAVAPIGKFLPAAMVKRGFTILLTGDTQSFAYVAEGLCAWGLCLFVCTVSVMWSGERSQLAWGRKRQPESFHVPPLGMVMLRRLLHRKSMWLSLGFIVMLSAVITNVERNSRTQIKAAVYDVSGTYGELLCAYDGVVDFELYESDEAVQNAVRKGDVECGYILPENLGDDMIAMRAEREILVYQDADAVAVPVVDEILFERIFRQVSLRWFEEYMLRDRVVSELGMDDGRIRQIVETCFNGELLAGKTFGVEIRRLGTRTTEAQPDDSDAGGENRTVYPVYAAAAVAVILCALQGVLQVIADIRQQNFYKRNRVAASALTLLLPLVLGFVCAGLLLMAGM